MMYYRSIFHLISSNQIKMNFLVVILLFGLISVGEGLRLAEQRALHAAKRMTNAEISSVAALADDDYFNNVLDKILVPRVSGSQSIAAVQKFLTNEMRNNGFSVELHKFQDITPIFGKVNFVNIIASNNNNLTRQLVLACHYDSKYFENNSNFVGATDSAAPCAMLVHMAKVLGPHLTSSEVGLTLVFFDGEEAFHEWGPRDSIYGARALARKWETSKYSSLSNALERVDLFVLLDLIGTANQQYFSFFENTAKWHLLLSKIEKKLKSMNIIPYDRPKLFLEKSTDHRIEDDHLPFLRKNIPVLHVIPIPFPSVWHLPSDDRSAIDIPSVDTMNKILQVFVYAYINGST